MPRQLLLLCDRVIGFLFSLSHQGPFIDVFFPVVFLQMFPLFHYAAAQRSLS